MFNQLDNKFTINSTFTIYFVLKISVFIYDFNIRIIIFPCLFHCFPFQNRLPINNPSSPRFQFTHNQQITSSNKGKLSV